MRVLKFDEVIVFLDISDIEDEAVSYKLDSSGNVVSFENEEEMKDNSRIMKIKGLFRDNSILLFTILKVLKQTTIPQNYQINKTRSLWTIDETLYEEFGERGLENMEFYMNKLYDLLNRHGISLTIAVYPWPDQIYYKDLNSIQVAFWEKWANRKGILIINFFPYFINLDDSESEVAAVLKEYFIPTDVHWNEKGHQLMAEKFLEFYQKDMSDSN